MKNRVRVALVGVAAAAWTLFGVAGVAQAEDSPTCAYLDANPNFSGVSDVAMQYLMAAEGDESIAADALMGVVAQNCARNLPLLLGWAKIVSAADVSAPGSVQLVSLSQPQEDEDGWDCRMHGNRVCGGGDGDHSRQGV